MKLPEIVRTLLVYSLVFIGGALWYTTGQAATVNMHVDFAYNGDIDSTAGFKLYQRYDSDTVVIADIVGGAVRSWDGNIEVREGRSYYSLTAYNATGEESEHSNEYPFEYIEPVSAGLPAPTVIIKFN